MFEVRAQEPEEEKRPGEFHLSGDSVRAVSERLGPPPGHRRFTSTDHLSPEALAAFVDDALPTSGRQRARAHLDRCPQCRDEVREQEEVRRALRGSGPIRMPEELRTKLSVIAEHDHQTERPAGWRRWLRRIIGKDR